MPEKFSNVESRISLLMKEKGWTQKKLAEITNISTAAINNYCQGTRLPDTNSIFVISKALDTSIEWLLTGEGDKQPCRDADDEPSIWELQDYQQQAANEHYGNLTSDQVMLLNNYEKLTLPNRHEIQAIISLKLDTQMEGRAGYESGTA